MRQTPWVRWSVAAAVGLVVVACGFRPTLRAGQPSALIGSTAVGGAFGGGDEQAEPPKVVHVAAPPMSLEAARVWIKLQDKLAMNFPNDTPLEDVIKYISQATTDAKGGFPRGIPIYLDPQGLQDADKTSNSTVTINIEGMPLATTLELVLRQQTLEYYIQKDGLLIITSREEKEAQTDHAVQILNDLNALRTEVRSLRQEIRTLRGVEVSEKGQGGARGAMGGSMGGPR